MQSLPTPLQVPAAPESSEHDAPAVRTGPGAHCSSPPPRQIPAWHGPTAHLSPKLRSLQDFGNETALHSPEKHMPGPSSAVVQSRPSSREIGCTKHWSRRQTPALHGFAALKHRCFSRAPSQSTTGNSVTVDVVVVFVIVPVDVVVVPVDVVIVIVEVVVVDIVDVEAVVVVTVVLTGRVSQYLNPKDGFSLIRHRSIGQSFNLYSRHWTVRGVVVVVVVLVAVVVVVPVVVETDVVVLVVVLTVVVVSVVVFSTQKSAPLIRILSQRSVGQHAIMVCSKQPVSSEKSEQSASSPVSSPSSVPP